MKLKSFEVLQSVNRISSIDVFRGFAIIPVVIFHFFGFLPYGYLSVDLFFVISGFLVGSILIKSFIKDERINFFKFFLQRGFKIWPSYYCFLIIGTLLAYLFYHTVHPEFVLVWSRSDISRYLFFYENYTGIPFHWPFDHIWSLCVEEHFYILFPVMMIVIMSSFGNKKIFLFIATGLLILVGIAFKYVGMTMFKQFGYMSGTHNRIDALGWGILLGLLMSYFEATIRVAVWRKHLFLIGAVVLALNICGMHFFGGHFYEKVLFHSIAPFCFFLMILGVYFHDFSSWKVLRFISYYCYNWYLWHPLFVWVISRYVGISMIGLIAYMLISFITAIIFTILVEEKFLKMRAPIINRIFKPNTVVYA